MKNTRLLLTILLFVCAIVTFAQDRALGHATSNGKLEKVKRLIEKGADVDSKSYKGLTPLVIALKYKKIVIARYLIEKGADVNLGSEQKWIPLTIATRHDQSEIVELLIKYGADIDKLDGFGHNATYYARRRNNQYIW